MFFFSSRRRHTRCSRDWSSDVCSSDLLVTVNDSDKPTVLPIARRFHELGVRLTATEGTARYLRSRGVPAERVAKVHEGRPNAIDLIVSGGGQLLVKKPPRKVTQAEG